MEVKWGVAVLVDAALGYPPPPTPLETDAAARIAIKRGLGLGQCYMLDNIIFIRHKKIHLLTK